MIWARRAPSFGKQMGASNVEAVPLLTTHERNKYYQKRLFGRRFFVRNMSCIINKFIRIYRYLKRVEAAGVYHSGRAV
jgi:hypothetical protein